MWRPRGPSARCGAHPRTPAGCTRGSDSPGRAVAGAHQSGRNRPAPPPQVEHVAPRVRLGDDESAVAGEAKPSMARRQECCRQQSGPGTLGEDAQTGARRAGDGLRPSCRGRRCPPRPAPPWRPPHPPCLALPRKHFRTPPCSALPRIRGNISEARSLGLGPALALALGPGPVLGLVLGSFARRKREAPLVEGLPHALGLVGQQAHLDLHGSVLHEPPAHVSMLFVRGRSTHHLAKVRADALELGAGGSCHRHANISSDTLGAPTGALGDLGQGRQLELLFAPEQDEPAEARDDDTPRPRKPWAWLLRHVFQADFEHCPRCNGTCAGSTPPPLPSTSPACSQARGLGPRAPPPFT